MTTATELITAEQLLAMPADQRCELVRGELQMMAPAGFDHGVVGMTIARRLANLVSERRLGLVLGADTGFRLSREPDTVRSPDVAFVRASRLPPGGPPTGYWEGAPDLAVEILSPNDTVEEIEDKVDEYLAAGAAMVWVVNPKRRTVTLHAAGANPVILRQGDTLDGGDVVPGFQCLVADLFK